MGILLNSSNNLVLFFCINFVAQDHEDVEYMARKLSDEYRKWSLDVKIIEDRERVYRTHIRKRPRNSTL